MENINKFVVDLGHARGETITEAEIIQSIRDISNWLEENISTYIASPGLPMLPNDFPEILQVIMRIHNGGLQLLETFVTLNLSEIEESMELCKVSIYWKVNYFPFARNHEGEFLMVEGNGEVLQWNLDIGVVEQIDKNLEVFFENFRNKLLSRRYQYLGDDCGLIEMAE